jgi:hypothetical protein
METTMIISMDDYRRIDGEFDSGADSDRRRMYEQRGNAVPALQLAQVQNDPLDAPVLPVDFDDFDAKEFIERAYALATHI